MKAQEEKENKQSDQAATGDSDTSRQRSTISFPYGGLDDALAVAKALSENGGLGDMDQLAAWLKHDNVISGAFRLKVSAARIFGLIEVKDEKATLTDLGNEIARPESESKARALAFLKVPLYRAMFEKYKGRLLPGNAVLESDMVALGVAPKQKARARQGFQRSAELAKMGKDRLVLPAGVSLDSKVSNGGASRKMDATITTPVSETNPLLLALFDELPPQGTEWSRDAREQWLRILQRTLDRLYPDKPE